MILEDKIVSVNVSQCTTTQEMEASVDEKEVNINVTTCFESDEVEGIFDNTFDISFN